MATSTFVGVFIAYILMEIGLAEKISKPLKPLMKACKLPKELSIPAMMGVLDHKAEHSVISSLRKNNLLNDSAVLAYNLATMPLSFVFFFFKLYLPVVIVSLGLYVGLLYIAFSLLTSMVAMIVGIAYGRVKLECKSINIPQKIDSPVKKKTVAKNSLKKAMGMTTYVIKRYILVLITMTALTFVGFFDWLKVVIQSYTSSIGFSPEFAFILSVQSVNPTIGILTAGEILRKSLISIKEVLIALLLGRLLFLIIFDYPRHSFPFYVSMYPAKLAAKLTMALILVQAIATPILLSFVIFSL